MKRPWFGISVPNKLFRYILASKGRYDLIFQLAKTPTKLIGKKWYVVIEVLTEYLATPISNGIPFLQDWHHRTDRMEVKEDAEKHDKRNYISNSSPAPAHSPATSFIRKLCNYSSSTYSSFSN